LPQLPSHQPQDRGLFTFAPHFDRHLCGSYVATAGDNMDLIDTQEAIKILNISKSAFCALCRDGTIKAVKVKNKWMSSRDDVIKRGGASPADISVVANMTPCAVRYHIRRGNLKANKIGTRYYCNEKEVNRWLKKINGPRRKYRRY